MTEASPPARTIGSHRAEARSRGAIGEASRRSRRERRARTRRVAGVPAGLLAGVFSDTVERASAAARASARTAVAATTLALAPIVPAAAEEAVLVGGGPSPERSQGQIELNARWVRDVLVERKLPHTLFFTDGDAPGPDVHYEPPYESASSALEPLARTFGEERLERRRYREHALEGVAGGTRRETLEPALAELFARTADEPLLFVYNGHGSQSPASPAGVTLDLWEKTSLSARELHAMLEVRDARTEDDGPGSSAPGARADGAPFRYVFTQCYSGGFHRLAYADPDEGLALAATPRCGFTAESAYRLAEGCSAGIDIGDYRDYTTYFFAALADRERDDTVLDRDPDLDADGTTTLREAHLYTLGKARSTDLSRSSSEDWLERWQPWYLRWLPQPRNLPNNEYARLFRALAAEAGLPLDDRVGRVLRERLAEAEGERETLAGERDDTRAAVRAARARLRDEATRRWPALGAPYTTAYRELAADGELETVADWLATRPDYATLREGQDRDAALDAELLEAERAVTAVRKLLRLRRLAVLRGQLEAHASASERGDYDVLLACEETPLLFDGGTDVAAGED